jgi:hydrogenase/urease accessory protein HupE
MRTLNGRGTMRFVALTAAVIGLLAVPEAASAHGIGGSSKSVGGFVWQGTIHMLTGWDHLLFIAGVVLLAGQVKRAASMISLYALGHSVTLFTATVAGWRINPTAVDVVIALSVVFVGIIGLIGRPKTWAWFAAVVFAFGLVHGLGLSTRLQDLGLPDEGLIPRVLAFNVGVELGQVLAVVAMFMIGDVLRHYIRWAQAPRALNGALVAGGLLAAGLVVFVTEPTNEQSTSSATSIGSCEIRDRTESLQLGNAGHPDKKFYEPTEATPEPSFAHVLGDGYVIVQYQPSLPAAQVTQLRQFVTGPDGTKVVGGPGGEQTETVKAFHYYDTLVCQDVDLEALKEFRDRWAKDPRSRSDN